MIEQATSILHQLQADGLFCWGGGDIEIHLDTTNLPGLEKHLPTLTVLKVHDPIFQI